MASRLSTGPQARPEQARPDPGQILIVIHDFIARSSDELSLAKGDRVELIERDDDFGDGWYLGRHLTNSNSGLFPEVYTRIAPRGPPSYPPPYSSLPRSQPPPSVQPVAEAKQDPPRPPAESTSAPSDARMAAPILDTDRTPQVSRHTSASEVLDTPDLMSQLTTNISSKENDKATNPVLATTAISSLPASLSKTSAAISHVHGQDSPVMNETLSVIDEHITDMNSPHHSVVADRRGTNDSGSEYSSHLDHRMSYINGEETDEEEEALHTREEVLTWNSDQVAEYLFTTGVESKHCEVFRDQEITGDVLLGMDQTSVFLKEFDLGSVGRRLKTWHKIKALQDDVNGETTSSKRNTATYGSEIGSDDASRNRSRSESMTMPSSMSSSMLPRIPSMMDRPRSRQNTRLSQQQLSRNDTVRASPTSPTTLQESPRSAGDKRPSAASIRDMHHSRQNSANDFSAVSLMGAVAGNVSSSPQLPSPEGHRKQPSFDRNWTMSGPASPPMSTPLPSRPLSSSGLQGISRSTTDQPVKSTPSTTLDALDRGYFSGGEVEGKPRNVLRKRTTSQSTHHSRNSSYTDEQRIRSGTTHTRHSRFGSVDSMRAATPPSASQKYYGLSVANGRRRTPSESSINTPPRPAPPPKDIPSPLISPTVTKLEGSPYEKTTSPTSTKGRPSDWLLPVKPTSNSRHFGLRAISDAVTGNEKSKVTSPNEQPVVSPLKDALDSPSTRTGSSTPSGHPSLDLDTPDTKTPIMMAGTNMRTARKKSKKETSAYTRGLEKKSPQEQMADADYSGWMKKKSTNLMTTWKPRLFVLKGRRLSYYYSENDDQEKGLIDISFHRVLPADNDRLTGLHATLTGATNSPTSPNGPRTTDTIASKQAAAEPESTLSKSSGDSMFIFKLVPPRVGLSRAVTFTKPTVHYFAVPNIKQGRLWMAALMKATIDRDDSKPITTTYQQKTISLAKARQMRHRPPALMNLDENVDEEAMKTPASDKHGLNIQGIIYDRENTEGDSGVSGMSKNDASKAGSAGLSNGNSHLLELENIPEPKTA